MADDFVEVITVLSSDEETPPLVTSSNTVNSGEKVKKTARKSTRSNMGQLSTTPVNAKPNKTETISPERKPMNNSNLVSTFEGNSNLRSSTTGLQKDAASISANGLSPIVSETSRNVSQVTTRPVLKTSTPINKPVQTARKSFSSEPFRQLPPGIKITAISHNQEPSNSTFQLSEDPNKQVRKGLVSESSVVSGGKLTISTPLTSKVKTSLEVTIHPVSGSTYSSSKTSQKENLSVNNSHPKENLKKKARKSFSSSNTSMPVSVLSSLDKSGVSIINVGSHNVTKPYELTLENNKRKNPDLTSIFNNKSLKISSGLSITEVKPKDQAVKESTSKRTEFTDGSKFSQTYADITKNSSISVSQVHSEKSSNPSQKIINHTASTEILNKKSSSDTVIIRNQILSLTQNKEKQRDETSPLSKLASLKSSISITQVNAEKSSNSSLKVMSGTDNTKTLNKKTSANVNIIRNQNLSLPQNQEKQQDEISPLSKLASLKSSISVTQVNAEKSSNSSQKTINHTNNTETSNKKKRIRLDSILSKISDSSKKQTTFNLPNQKQDKTDSGLVILPQSLQTLSATSNQKPSVSIYPVVSSSSQSLPTQKTSDVPTKFKNKSSAKSQEVKSSNRNSLSSSRPTKKVLQKATADVAASSEESRQAQRISALKKSLKDMADTKSESLLHGKAGQSSKNGTKSKVKPLGGFSVNSQNIPGGENAGTRKKEEVEAGREFKNLGPEHSNLQKTTSSVQKGNATDDIPIDKPRKQVTSPKLSLKRKNELDNASQKRLKVDFNASGKISPLLNEQGNHVEVPSRAPENRDTDNIVPWNDEDNISSKYRKFLEFCRPLMKSTPAEENQLINSFISSFNRADPSYTTSIEFIDLLKRTVTQTKAKPEFIFVHLRNLKSDLKLYKKKRPSNQNQSRRASTSSDVSDVLRNTIHNKLGTSEKNEIESILPDKAEKSELSSSVLNPVDFSEEKSARSSPSLLCSTPVESTKPDSSFLNSFYEGPSTSKQADLMDMQMIQSATLPGDITNGVKRPCNRKSLSGEFPSKFVENHKHSSTPKQGIEKDLQPKNSPMHPQIEPDAKHPSLKIPGLKNNMMNKIVDPESVKEGFDRRIKALENHLAKLDKKIKKLQTKELSLDDLDDDDSTYIQEDRYKRKFRQIWEKLCSLKKRSSRVGREVERRFNYEGTRHKPINTAIEKVINKRKAIEKFPNYVEVLEIIRKCNKEDRLLLTSIQEEKLAKEVFEDVGVELKRRRLADEEYDLASYVPDEMDPDNDPADHDQNLKDKLISSVTEGERKLAELIDKYAERDLNEGDFEVVMEEEQETSEDEIQAPIPELDPATPSTDEREDIFDAIPPRKELPSRKENAGGNLDIIDIGSSSDASTEPGTGVLNENRTRKNRPNLLTDPPVYISDDIEVFDDTGRAGSDSSPDLLPLEVLINNLD